MKLMNAIAAAALLASPFAFAACTAHTPDALAQARQEYQQAAQGPAAKYAPGELAAAKEALDRAEAAFDDDDSQEAYDLAYIADRKARVATTKGGIAMQQEQQRVADAEAAQIRDRISESQRAQLAAARAEGDEALRRAREAELALQQAGAVRETERGKVITLQGNVLFKSGRSDLLPGAKESLDQVASVLTTMRDRQLTIEGYTDSRGSDTSNQKLSESRAYSVRDYLVSRGVNPEQLRIQGMGESAPIADNRTAEGRAMNRRDEIVVGNEPTTMGASREVPVVPDER
jgi:outer membrane protein OmpA-like peptidoglycan-associated protein